MLGLETQEVERKVLTILKILSDSKKPLGARIIADRLKKGYGIDLSERTVRYHLKLTDERRLTKLVGRDGRLITELGIEEISNALVEDKVGLAISRIELLTFLTDFNYDKATGSVPVNISIFPKDKFNKALHAMKPVFAEGLCVSDRIAVAYEGEQLGKLIVPEGHSGLATVCSLVINGTLLKAGIPMNSRFGGILQIQNHQPLRFVEFIRYDGSSLDPSEVFIRARMTSTRDVVKTGEGKILANFREIPALCRSVAEEMIDKLAKAGLRGLLVMGKTSEPVCEIPVELNRIGMAILGGLNPVAAAHEAGIEAKNYAMSTIMEYQNLVNFSEVAK